MPPLPDGSLGTPQKRRRWVLPVVIIVILLLLGVGTVVAAEAGVLPFQLPFKLPFTLPFVPESDAALLERMLVELPNLKTGEVSATLELASRPRSGEPAFDYGKFLRDSAKDETPGASPGQFAFDFLPADITASFTLAAKLESWQKPQEADAEVGLSGSYVSGGTTYKGNVLLRLVNDVLYVNAEELPTFPGFDPQPIVNQWIKITKEDREGGLLPLPMASGEKPIDLQKDLEQLRIVQKAALETNFIVTEKVTSTETVNSVRSRHLRYRFDFTNLKAFYDRAVRDLASYGDDALVKDDPQTRKLYESSAITAQADAMRRDASFDLWIAPATAHPVQYETTIRFTPDASAEKYKDKEFTLTTRATFSNLNGTIAVEAPTETISAEEAQQLLLGGAGTNTNVNSNLNTNGTVNTNVNTNTNSAVDSDSDGLTDLEEELYGTDPQKADTDGDGYRDGDEVKNGYNPNGEGKL